MAIDQGGGTKNLFKGRMPPKYLPRPSWQDPRSRGYNRRPEERRVGMGDLRRMEGSQLIPPINPRGNVASGNLGKPVTKPNWLTQFSSALGTGAEANRVVKTAATNQLGQGAMQLVNAMEPVLQARQVYSTSPLHQAAPLNTSSTSAAATSPLMEINAPNLADLTRKDLGLSEGSSLASGFYEWLNPETGEYEMVALPEDVTERAQELGGEPLPSPTLLPDTWQGQRDRWWQMMRAFAASLGVTPTLLPDTFFGQQNRLLEQYYAPQPQAQTWYSSPDYGWYGDGGGGGGGGDYEPSFWLDRVKWNI